VLYATNREINGPVLGDIDPINITDRRSLELAYGSAMVRIPEFHEIGNVERRSDSDLTFFGITIWKAEENKSKYFTLSPIKGLTREQFVTLLDKGKKDGIMVFVHGIATSFEDAIFKTAQIAFETNFPGVPVAFSWPSRESVWSYDYDRESALVSRDAFLDVLRAIYQEAEVSNVYVIAHSMGNQIVVDALAHAQDAGLGLKVSELVMAAPDVDSDVFRSLVSRLMVAAKGLTLYASSADKAMLASRLKAGGVPRAGDVPATGPLLVEGMDTIDVTAIGSDLLGLNHSEYSGNRALLDDIGRILRTSTRPPDLRSPQLRRVPERSEHPLYWRYAE